MSRIKKSITIQILIATALGVIAGIVFGSAVTPVKILGDIFLRLIQMSIPILVLGQIIEAVGNLNPHELGTMGIKTVVIFLFSSLLAAVFGLLFGLIFNPGAGVDHTAFAAAEEVAASQTMSVGDVVLSFFPSNIMESMSQGTIVHIIIFAILFGIALSFIRTSAKSDTLMIIVEQINITVIKMISIIMKIAPIGVFALVASSIGEIGAQIILPMAKYLGVYALCTVIFLLIWFVTTCLYCQVGFIQLCKNLFSMSIVALVTTSSAVTLPVALDDSQHKLGVGEPVAKLVLPLGMPLNSNGSAMYLAITMITIAQIFGIGYDSGQLIYLVILASLVSLANAVVPGAGLIALAIVVPAMGLPKESIALFAGVDWFTGMIRTILNVDSDALTAMLVAKSEKDFHKDIFNQKNDLA